MSLKKDQMNIILTSLSTNNLCVSVCLLEGGGAKKCINAINGVCVCVCVGGGGGGGSVKFCYSYILIFKCKKLLILIGISYFS